MAADEVYETEHYRVRFSGSTQDAVEYTQVLEAAWEPLEQYFGAAPALDEDERLVVHVYDTAQEWLAAASDGHTKLTAQDAGCYSPITRIASLHRQPTRYDTRVLLLHECIHQFHFLARRSPGLPAPAWYGEGVAEYLSLHTWDGERLRLGVQPTLSLREYPERAREELAAPLPHWGPLLAGRAPVSRPLAWALVRWFETREEPSVRGAFRRFGRQMDDGVGMPVRTLARELGRAVPEPAELAQWLETVRQPWVPATNGWEDTGGGTIRGRSPGLALCRLRDPVVRLAASLRVPESGARTRGGLLLHWSDPEDFTTALVHADGTLRVERRKDGRWWPQFAAEVGELGDDRVRRLVAERAGPAVTLTVDDQTFGPWELPSACFGLAVERSDLRFGDLRWQAPPAPTEETAARPADSRR